MEEAYYLHLLNCLPQFGPIRLNRLINYFPDYLTAFESSRSELKNAGIEPNVIDLWFQLKPSLNLESEIKRLENLNISLLPIYSDVCYPRLLREINAPPALLYYRGTVTESEELCFAIVGTRKISSYGQSVTPDIVTELLEQKITIVSGLAYGVDALAHQITVKHQARTIAVLGGGLDDQSIYPSLHKRLAKEIIHTGGLLLSEHPPGRAALKQNFVVRNRIISGLAVGVLVVECGLKSGALITAKYASDQNRNVYAIPGPIYSSTSQGPNELLKAGAKPVTSARDILEDLRIDLNIQSAPREFIMLTEQEQMVLATLGREPMLTDNIIATSPLHSSITTASLTFLEIKGYIKNIGGQQYVRIK